MEEPDLESLQVTSEPLEQFLGEYKEVDNYYSDGRALSIVRDEDDGYLYRRYTDAESKGQKLYYLGDNTFGYEPYPMDRVIFTLDPTGRVLAFNNFWNGLKKGGLYRKVR